MRFFSAIILPVLLLGRIWGAAAQDAPDEYAEVSTSLRKCITGNDAPATLSLMKRLQDLAPSLLLVDGRSPALLAIAAGNTALGKQLLEAYPVLLETEAEMERYQVRTPFFLAVERGDLALVQWLVEKHVKFDNAYWPYDRPEVPANALALSHDPAMSAYLQSLGLPTLYEVKGKASPTPPWTANDDNVNIRSDPDAKAAVVGKLKKGEKVAYFGNTTYSVIISGSRAYWLKISTKSKLTGWVFSRFLDSPWVGEE